jgi:hypothetical protein
MKPHPRTDAAILYPLIAQFQLRSQKMRRFGAACRYRRPPRPP